MSSPWSQEGSDPAQPGLSGGGYQPDSSYQPDPSYQPDSSYQPLVGRPGDAAAPPPADAPAGYAPPGPTYQTYQTYEPPAAAPQPAYQVYPGSYPNQGLAPYASAAYAEHPNATAVLVLGILSLVLCQLLGPVAWIMGQAARGQTLQGRYLPSGKVTAGWICGIISTVLMLLWFFLMIVSGLMSS